MVLWVIYGFVNFVEISGDINGLVRVFKHLDDKNMKLDSLAYEALLKSLASTGTARVLIKYVFLCNIVKRKCLGASII
jgi:hypothetical protein